MFDEPDGTVRNGLRLESDSMGKVWVKADRLWGAGTQRALVHFRIGEDLNPAELTRAIVIVKQAAAKANRDLGKLDEGRAKAILLAAEEAVVGKLDSHFPLPVWGSGSGTQLNMNVNEVLANRAIQILDGTVGTKTPVHPNDHVNMSQSTNDVFPTAMNVAASLAIRDHLVPMVEKLRDGLDEKTKAWANITKIGRTHLMDAVPLTLGQEFSGYAAMVDDDLTRLEAVLPGLYRLAIGGTAVGTGLTAEKRFGELAVRHIAEITHLPVTAAPNRFAVQGAHDAMVMVSGALKTMAVSLFKIANDIRLLASGPDSGLHELILPANEPGSSIMPGKVNPTQCEAMTMVAVQVMGYDAAVAIAGAGGYLEMNVYKPLIAFNVIQSIRLISDACSSFTEFLVAGMKPNRKRIDEYVNRSLMLVTALVPSIGYDRAAKVAHLAAGEGLTLKEAALKLGYISADEFDRIVDPGKMVDPDG
ncbi:MAG: class II fumarate hydratase [Syntrophorhabdaceae bacterium]|nr:class II fumarate hydratase [Syntrophorhabdaceae bacterium]HOD75462.1 class II fumarate hydratase [Syntrophorhabdaceae bacterium]